MGFASIRECTVACGALAGEKADLLVLPVSKDAAQLPAEASALLGADGPAALALASGDFKADPNEVLLVYSGHPAFPRVLLLGTGQVKDLTLERIRSTAAAAARRARGPSLATTH